MKGAYTSEGPPTISTMRPELSTSVTTARTCPRPDLFTITMSPYLYFILEGVIALGTDRSALLFHIVSGLGGGRLQKPEDELELDERFRESEDFFLEVEDDRFREADDLFLVGVEGISTRYRDYHFL